MYLGNQPALSYTSFAKQDFTTSATTSYTLDQPVANENEIALFINFVRQEPTTAYTASGTTLTLTSATSASDDMYCVFLGKAIQTVNPPNGSVGSSQVASSIITGQTAETSIATDDLILLSDTSASGALKKMTRANFVSGIGGNNTPNFWIYKSANQSISNMTTTKIAFDSAVIDTASGLASNKWTVPVGSAGTYFLTAKYIWSGTWTARIVIYISKNSSGIFGMQAHKESVDGGIHVNGIATLAEGDELEVEIYQDSGSSRDIVGGSLWNSLSGFKLI